LPATTMTHEAPRSQQQAPAPSPGPLFFLHQVDAATPGHSNIDLCIQCGTCGGSCPSSSDMDYTPRHIMAMIRADMREQVLRSNTAWYCVSCYFCTVRCPQDVHVTDIMYTLKRLAVRDRAYSDATAADFSRTFISWVENYGRAFELGLMSMHALRHNLGGMISLAPMGLGMVSKRRMDFTPKGIKDIDGLKAILAKAKELEASDEV
jgi:heterodisulfide reductase subunit C